jgi:hypothetical protein
MAAATNTGSTALRKFRRDLQGKGVNLRRTTGITGAAANTPFTVPGLGVLDELVSVLYCPKSVAYVAADTPTEILTMTPAVAVQAFLTPAGQGANAQLKYIADSAYPGAAGNAITVQYVISGTSIVITVTGTAILVTAPATATGNAVLAALAANEKAMALVTVDTPSGDGTGVIVAVGPTNLAGGVDANVPNVVIVQTPAVQAFLTPGGQGANAQLKYIADSAYPGTKGNAITVQYVISGTSIVITVTGTAILITAPTVNTANDVLAALAGNEKAMALVTVDTPSGNGTGAIVAVGPSSLAGGVDPVVQIKSPTATNTNAADTVTVDFLSRS